MNNTVTMEYFPLESIDNSFPFIYRFVNKEVETGWKFGFINPNFLKSKPNTFDKEIRVFANFKYREFVSSSGEDTIEIKEVRTINNEAT